MGIRGAIKEPDYAITSLPRVEQAIGKSKGLDATDKGWLIRAIAAVTRIAENDICHRRFRRRTYTHDGTTAAKAYLDGTGSRDLFLPNTPVLSITELKRRFDEQLLTEGPDGNFVVDPHTGRIRLRYYKFSSEPGVVHVIYIGGFEDQESGADPTKDDAQFGWDGAGADIQMAATEQVVDWYNRRKNGDRRVVSITTEAGTVNLNQDDLLENVKRVFMSKRNTI